MAKKSSKINPIDKDKIAENPHLLPYAHTLGGAIIKPIDKGRVKGLAMNAMYEQSGQSLERIKKQIEQLVEEAQDIHHRIDVSEKIYEAECNFKPLIGRTYYLYQNKNNKWILSMISPDEWGKKLPYEYLETVKLMSDHTWQILEPDNQNNVEL